MIHKYMIRNIGLASLMLFPFVMADAAPLTPEAALQRAMGNSSGQRMPGSVKYSLSYTEKAGGENMLYVFNKGDKGFVVVSADDALSPILGYSDNGAFDYDAAPPQLKWWLGEYATQGAYALKNADLTSLTRNADAARVDRAQIEPLVKTKWGQNDPYNLDCPTDAGGKTVTGCVATAMAQIIKYHGYPTQGKGDHGYVWNGELLSFNYGEATFDYANMLDEYGKEATEEQRKAVAQLMYACGVGVNMNYSSYMSGTGDYAIPFAFVNLFNYDSGVKYVKRAYYTTAEWENLVYSELEAKRPVIYGGQAPGGGGHEFVCDGYDEGYFHINWGWNGSYDGYFSLSNLLPDGQGTGGFDGGYNTDQGIVMGIKPNPSESAPTPNIALTGGLTAEDIRGNQIIQLGVEGGMICNYGPEEANVPLAFKMVSSSGTEYIGDAAEYTFPGALEAVMGFGGFGLYLPQNVPAGEYTGYVVYKNSNDEWEEVLAPISMASYLVVNVDGAGNFTAKPGEPRQKAEIKVTAFAPTTVVMPGVDTRFDVSVVNVSDIEYSGMIYIRTYVHDTNEEINDAMHKVGPLAIGPESSFNGSVSLDYALEEGLYDVIIYDSYGDKISEIFPLWIGVPPVYVSSVEISESTATMAAGTTYQLTATVYPANADNPTVVWSSSNPEVANVDETGLVTAFAAGEVTITVASVEAEDKAAACVITVYMPVESVTLNKTVVEAEEGSTVVLEATILPEDATNKTLAWTSSDESVATVDEQGVVTIHAIGEATITATTTDGTDLKAECVVTGIAGIDEIVADDALIDIYTVGGVLVKKGADKSYLSTLGKGVYLLVIDGKTIKVAI